MSLAAEFKEFAMKGNVIDLAAGVVIGAAFGKIISALVDGVIMPPLGLLAGGADFSELALRLGSGPGGEPVLLRYGMLLQTVFEFLLIALALFALIKGINRLKRPPEIRSAPAPAPEPTKSELLLAEIRDLLAKR